MAQARGTAAARVEHHARSQSSSAGSLSVYHSTSSFQNRPPLIHDHPIYFRSFYTHETHGRVYTNKPRALLMQQALYNEPKRARLLWEVGLSVQTLGVLRFKKKPSSPFCSPWICTCPNHTLLLLNRQCTQVPRTKAGQPLW